ncbi:MAG: hypothetical protein MJZ75_02950 [Paludibacteraceae bacterium]|nr:hypothetical protein [Paludibacteraceae bacterium]
MKKFSYLLVLCTLVLLGANSCTPKDEVASPQPDRLLIGTWQENATRHFVRFLSADEDPMVGEYRFGYEWDEDDDVHPEDLIWHGNGWFKWKVETDTVSHKSVIRLTEIQLMDNGGAELPDTYIITTLNSTTFEYAPEDNLKFTHCFTKAD